MTHEQKINYMRIAAGIAGFSIANEHLDLLVSIYDKVTEKEGKTDLHDIVNVEHEVQEREKERKRKKKEEEQKNNNNE
jgi:hypothetical protein